MLGEAISFVRRNLSFVCVVVAANCALVAFDDYSGGNKSNSAQFFVALSFGFFIQKAILNGDEKVSNLTDKRGFGGYIWKNLLIMLVVIGIGIGAPVAFGAASLSKNVFLLLCLAVIAIILPLLLALVGTWPIAGIAGSNSGLSAAFSRGKRGLAPTFLRLFAGLFLPFIGALILMTAATSMSYEADSIFSDGKLNLIALAILVICQWASIFGLCYVSIVLARKLLSSEAPRPPFGGRQGNAIAATSVSEVFE
ncbi:hypothetical protein [Rhizobium hidalgonense]|uniref:hypothetical protein n=1 Tax=Rhizobium hidalgonense TaxID=1538159 RepID=UPI000FEC5D76|nr:hypothetical protein [Rhizobium hidalgonense]MDR9804351.1 hypothetical protein [Rhizobium hidalgonense]QKK25512.1 hypothetical protein FFM81_020165 [Rhizobium hidalgonense]RWX16073.1 hypothetical protein EHI42_13945 [Rhizobium hidalgonense]